MHIENIHTESGFQASRQLLQCQKGITCPNCWSDRSVISTIARKKRGPFSMKFIHSSDLQIGKAFGYFEPEVANALQDARQAVVRTLGEAAINSGATWRCSSLGTFTKNNKCLQPTLARAIENMRAFKSVQWHLMPGNHDHFRENGLWDRLTRMQLPRM